MSYDYQPSDYGQLKEASVAFSHPAAQTLAPAAASLSSLDDKSYRTTLTPSSLKLFIALMNKWDLPVKQRQTLAGGIPKPTYDTWRRGSCGTLSRDQLERISLLLGIQKAMRLLFVNEQDGQRWFKSVNRDFPFSGLSPLDFALQGSMEHLYGLRRYLDAWRGVK